MRLLSLVKKNNRKTTAEKQPQNNPKTTPKTTYLKTDLLKPTKIQQKNNRISDVCKCNNPLKKTTIQREKQPKNNRNSTENNPIYKQNIEIGK